jgi:hypothetical protein
MTNRILKLFISSFFCVFLARLASAQDMTTSHLQWESDESWDASGRTVAYQAVFKTHKTASVEWVQKQGAKASSYTVTQVEGTWTNVMTPGSMIYTTTHRGNTIWIKFERTETNTYVWMNYGQGYKYRFRIRAVTEIP